MSENKAAFEAIDKRFRDPSKQRDAARYIVRMNRTLTSEERKAIVDQIPIANSTLSDLLTELKKMGLYPPKAPSKPADTPAAPEETAETSLHHVPEAPEPLLQEYATKEDFEILKTSINYLAAVVSGVDPETLPETLGEDEEEEEEVEVIQLEEVELVPQEEIIIEDPSLIRKTIFLKPITMLLFDLARVGAFPNYVGTNEPGPFTNVKNEGLKKINLSDFFNNMAEDYSNHLYNMTVGLQKYIEDIEIS